MADAATAVRAAMIGALRAEPVLDGVAVGAAEERRADLPRVEVAWPRGADWGAQGLRGRELAVLTVVRGAPGQFARTVGLALFVEEAALALPAELPGGWRVASARFVRSAPAGRGEETAFLVEHRVRVARVH